MTVEYRAGTPQRVALNQLIADLADRQAELSSETVKPAGWTWQPTGEKLGDWWARQDTTARNVWLRSMNIRMGFWCSTGSNGRVDVDRVNLDLGDLFELTRQMNAGGPVAEWQAVLNAMRDKGVAAIEINGEDIHLILKGA